MHHRTVYVDGAWLEHNPLDPAEDYMRHTASGHLGHCHGDPGRALMFWLVS